MEERKNEFTWGYSIAIYNVQRSDLLRHIYFPNVLQRSFSLIFFFWSSFVTLDGAGGNLAMTSEKSVDIFDESDEARTDENLESWRSLGKRE